MSMIQRCVVAIFGLVFGSSANATMIEYDPTGSFESYQFDSGIIPASATVDTSQSNNLQITFAGHALKWQQFDTGDGGGGHPQIIVALVFDRFVDTDTVGSLSLSGDVASLDLADRNTDCNQSADGYFCDFAFFYVNSAFAETITGLNLDYPALVGPDDPFRQLVGARFFLASTTKNALISVTTVPEPGSLVLFSAGLLGLVALRRRVAAEKN